MDELPVALRREAVASTYSAHNPNFIVDLKAIPAGTRVATVSMLELLSKNPAKLISGCVRAALLSGGDAAVSDAT